MDRESNLLVPFLEMQSATPSAERRAGYLDGEDSGYKGREAGHSGDTGRQVWKVWLEQLERYVGAERGRGRALEGRLSNWISMAASKTFFSKGKDTSHKAFRKILTLGGSTLKKKKNWRKEKREGREEKRKEV